MRSSFTRSLVVVVVVLSAALLACKGGSSSGAKLKEVKASCDMRNGSSDNGSVCWDFHVEPNEKVKALCAENSGTLATTPCPHSTALGGCQMSSLTNWYYSSGKYSSADDVKKECPGTFVAATP
jgi:hypothetical protein